MRHDARPDRRIPLLAWALVAGAAAHLAIWAAVNWYRIFGPYLIVRVEDFVSISAGVAPYLLAAAVLVAADRWRAGRGWMYAGAALVAVHAVAYTAAAAWWAWRSADPIAPEGPLAVALVAGNLVAVAAGASAPICLALGLRRAQPRRAVPALVTGLAIAIGLVAVAANLGLLARESAFGSALGSAQATYVALAIVQRTFMAVGAVGLLLLAHAALGGLPALGSAAAALIATGATLAAAGSAATSAGQALLSIETQSEHLFWVFSLPATIDAVGDLLLVAGFAAAALTVGSRAVHRPGQAATEAAGG